MFELLQAEAVGCMVVVLADMELALLLNLDSDLLLWVVEERLMSAEHQFHSSQAHTADTLLDYWQEMSLVVCMARPAYIGRVDLEADTVPVVHTDYNLADPDMGLLDVAFGRYSVMEAAAFVHCSRE